jgi:hypothetical protein
MRVLGAWYGAAASEDQQPGFDETCYSSGGTISAEGQYTPYLAYTYSHGKMFNNLLAARYAFEPFVIMRGGAGGAPPRMI